MTIKRTSKKPIRADKQTVGNVGMYYVCYRLSLFGWNAMPTSRNARGIDVLIYSQDGSVTHTIQVKTLSGFLPVPLGKSLSSTTAAHWPVVCAGVALGEPQCSILSSVEVAENAVIRRKARKTSCWLQTQIYQSPEFVNRWDRIGSGL